MSERILIVEDSPTQAVQLQFLLEDHGYHVTSAKNGQQGLAAAREHRPDLIISDIIMPIMNGYEMCHAIKHDEVLQGVPVILLTALSDPADIVRGLQAGTDYYVTKPYDEAHLLSTIELALSAPTREQGERTEEGLEVMFAGNLHIITAGRQQLLNLLLSTYGNAVQQNRELTKTQRELERLNERLETIVEERTAALVTEVAERQRAEEAVRVSHHFLEIANRYREMMPLLEEFVAEVKSFTGCDAVGARILDDEGNIPYQAYQGFSQEFYEAESPLSIKVDDCMCINVIKGDTDPNLPFYTERGSFYMNGTTLFLATVSEVDKGRTRNTCNAVGYESVALIPIRLGERILGLIHLADPGENMVPLETVAILESAAMQLGTAIQRVRAEEEVSRLARFPGENPNTVLRVEKDGTILYANKASRPLLNAWGCRVGQPLPHQWRKFTSEVFSSGSGKVTECEYEDRTLSLTFAPVVDAGYVNVYGLDITDRKQAENALQTSEERYRNIFQTAAVSLWEEDFSAVKTALDDLQARGVEDIGSYLDEHPDFVRQTAGLVQILDVNAATLSLFGARDKEELLGSLDRVLAPEGQDVFREELIAIAAGQTHFEGETVNQTLQGAPLNLLLAIRFPSEAQDFSSVLVGKVDITARKKREREREALATVSAALREATTRDEMLPVILDQLMNLLNADGVALALRDPNTGETVIELAYGNWLYWSGERLPPREGISGQVIATGQPYVDNDIQVDPLFGRPDVRFDLGAVACVPLTVERQPIGALWVGCRTAIADGDVHLLTALGDMAANAIQRATLHEQTEQRLQHITALRTIDMAITSSLDLRVTLGVILDQVNTQLSVDAADVLLFNPHTQTLEYAAGRGFRSRTRQYSHLRLGEGPAGRAALERSTVRIPNLAEDAVAQLRTSMVADEGFVAYCGVPLVAKGHVKGVLEVFHRAPLDFSTDWLGFLETVAGQAAIAIDSSELFDSLQRSNIELTLAYDTTLEGWARALELRDHETEGHAQRVVELTLRMARALGISEAEIMHVQRGALLHDIGKMGIPDGILLKPGQLTDKEWDIMRQHPVYAHQMLSPIAYLRSAMDIPYCHHEKWDGTGYPRGLNGAQIPLAARIFALVDVWDALLSDRPYRAAWPEERAIQHIREQAGKHFDPQVVEVFLRVIDSVE